MVSPMSLHQRFLVCAWISSCQKPSTPLSEWNALPRLFVSVPVPHHYLSSIIGLSAIFLSGDFFFFFLFLACVFKPSTGISLDCPEFLFCFHFSALYSRSDSTFYLCSEFYSKEKTKIKKTLIIITLSFFIIILE